MLLFAVLVLAVVLMDRWFFLWLRDYSARAHRTEVVSQNGNLALLEVKIALDGVGDLAQVVLPATWQRRFKPPLHPNDG